jgi:glycerol transport system substrate-binding protein
VDEWGIRVEDCHPVGASVARGGAVNSAAAVYATQKYVEWLKKYAPPEAAGMTFTEAGPIPGNGAIAQQIFWYSAFTKALTKPGLPVVNADGTPKWRMAPSPHGPYWKPGMQNGYQDVGSWTLMNYTDLNRRKAAWLYGQFCTCKTTSLKKTIVGLTPIRQSDIMSQPMTELAPKLGGLVEFYRSPARVAWTPTGNNVPDYPKLAQLFWQNVAVAVSGEKTAQAAMDNLASDMDKVLGRLERAGMSNCAPKLNKEQPPEYWYSKGTAPWPKLGNEKPKGETVAYDKLLDAWKQGRAM